MHVITRKRLKEFAVKFSDTENALADWYRKIKQNNFSNFTGLREMFPSADRVGKLTVLQCRRKQSSPYRGDTLQS